MLSLPTIPKHLKRARPGTNWRLFYTFLWQTGVRIGEGLAIERYDFQPDGSIIIRTEKSREQGFVRRLPLQATLYAACQGHIAILSPRRRRLFDHGDRRAAKVLKEAAAKAGYDPRLIHPHQIRHGFAKNYLRVNGTSPTAIKNLQTIMGHRSTRTTMMYLDPNFADLTADIERMDFGGRS